MKVSQIITTKTTLIDKQDLKLTVETIAIGRSRRKLIDPTFSSKGKAQNYVFEPITCGRSEQKRFDCTIPITRQDQNVNAETISVEGAGDKPVDQTTPIDRQNLQQFVEPIPTGRSEQKRFD